MVDAVGVLREECGALLGVLRGVAAAQLGLLSNCPPWNLGELIVHMGDSIRLRKSFPAADPVATVRSAADYYRRSERDTSEYRRQNVDKTRELAREVLAGASPVEWFEQASSDAVALLGGDDPGRVVAVPGRGAMRLGDWVVTRVIAIAAHGVDVAITLGREAWTTEAALGVIRPVFVELLGEEPPVSLGWDDGSFLAVATGRRGLSDGERAVLGEQAEQFPLLS